MQQAFFRGIAFALGFLFTTLIGMGGVAYAANTGLFGGILAKVLGVSDIASYTGDGTVKNALMLGGSGASSYQKVAPGQSCGAGRCMYGFDPSGNVQCR